jgi:hypothetical protein
MLNCNQYVPENERDDILQQFVLKMRRSGYSGKFRMKIINAADRIYKTKISEDSQGIRPLYRGRGYRAAERKLASEKKRINWCNKKQKGGKYYSAPLIMDPTPGGELKNEIDKICREEGEQGGMWIKVVERGGTKIKSVCKSNPLATKGCKRGNCGICNGKKPGRCDMASIGYRCWCMECDDMEMTSHYLGESGATGHARFLQHAAAVEKKQVDKSALAKHMDLQHGGMVGRFGMEITGNFRDCLTRLGDEGMRVREGEDNPDINIVMNSKSEFHQPPLIRLIAIRGNRNEGQDQQGQGTHQGRGRQRGGIGRGGRGVRARGRRGRVETS